MMSLREYAVILGIAFGIMGVSFGTMSLGYWLWGDKGLVVAGIVLAVVMPYLTVRAVEYFSERVG